MGISITEAASQTQRIQKMYSRWEKQGLTEEQRRVRLDTFLSESKRKYNKEEE